MCRGRSFLATRPSASTGGGARRPAAWRTCRENEWRPMREIGWRPICENLWLTLGLRGESRYSVLERPELEPLLRVIAPRDLAKHCGQPVDRQIKPAWPRSEAIVDRLQTYDKLDASRRGPMAVSSRQRRREYGIP
jgi:hypothetical protein